MLVTKTYAWDDSAAPPFVDRGNGIKPAPSKRLGTDPADGSPLGKNTRGFAAVGRWAHENESSGDVLFVQEDRQP